jgi:hypothetical protein
MPGRLEGERAMFAADRYADVGVIGAGTSRPGRGPESGAPGALSPGAQCRYGHI